MTRAWLNSNPPRLAVVLILTAALFAGDGLRPAGGQETDSGVATGSVPDWTFVVYGMQDPYAGRLITPREPEPGMRYVGFDVEVVNDSDQPLSVAANSFYLRDVNDFTYRSGSVIGS